MKIKNRRIWQLTMEITLSLPLIITIISTVFGIGVIAVGFVVWLIRLEGKVSNTDEAHKKLESIFTKHTDRTDLHHDSLASEEFKKNIDLKFLQANQQIVMLSGEITELKNDTKDNLREINNKLDTILSKSQ